MGRGASRAGCFAEQGVMRGRHLPQHPLCALPAVAPCPRCIAGLGWHAIALRLLSSSLEGHGISSQLTNFVIKAAFKSCTLICISSLAPSHACFRGYPYSVQVYRACHSPPAPESQGIMPMNKSHYFHASMLNAGPLEVFDRQLTII